MSRIGVLNETSLHASLKEWCAKPGSHFEVAVDGFVIDLVQDDVLLEIQTRNFASIKSKLTSLVRKHQVKLIHPIAQETWIIKQGADSCRGVTRRKSPKRGRIEDLFQEMVSFPELLADPNFSLEVLLIREEEIRRYEGKRRWRRQGWGIEERRLLEVVGRKVFEEPADLQALLPENLDKLFTTSDLAETMEIKRGLAQKLAYCLRKVGVIKLIGKRGRANLYTVVEL